MAKEFLFEGVYSALVTPMTDDEEVDYRMLSGFANYLIEEGRVHGLIPLGSTGEYYALTDQEREAVVKTTLEAAAGRVPVLVGANGGSTRQIVAYSRQAQQLGAAGLLLAAPYYSLPTQDELYRHFKTVNDAVGIPIMLYNYPGRTGVDMKPDLIERLAELRNIRYVKESTGDATRVTEIIRRCGERISVFCGCDTLALESFMMGAVGWVGGVVNALPNAHVRLFELAVGNKDLPAARELYYRLLPVLALMEGAGRYTQFVKAACALNGHPVGPPRRPLCSAGDDDILRLKELLASFDAVLSTK
ncbi:MAG: 4-hydroxy-tetrahydrodipicolinate synthase [Planctomycetota bacterium]|jgi:4-hydroxy-tetrahydrodipicolinate synthase